MSHGSKGAMDPIKNTRKNGVYPTRKTGNGRLEEEERGIT